MTEVLDRAEPDLTAEFAAHRVALTGYCYRMLASSSEAEDAVQETMLRAWKAQDGYEGRAAVKSWLYKIATNVCFDMLGSRQRRARPMDLGPCSYAAAPLAPPLTESIWVEPAADNRVLPGSGDPADVALARESVRLAFVAALQLLPPRQRAVLVLREVLRWSAAEVAELLGTSVASVNSALQRARATMDARTGDPGESLEPTDADQRALLEKYVNAFVAYDIKTLVGLLHHDATMNMPPLPLWLRGADEVGKWMLGKGHECYGSKVQLISANGMPAMAQWRVKPDGTYYPWAIQVIEIRDGAISGLTAFLDVDMLWPMFELPDQPPAE
ncbi:MAG: sigma-70 family RNA polymerase sigma factor [Sporichthyaceae bacterium]